MNNLLENNQVSIVGEIVSDFRYSHEVYGEGFYIVDVEVARLSGVNDTLPVMVSDRMMDVNENCVGALVRVSGQIRSFNRRDEDKNRLVLSLFAREIEFLDDMPRSIKCNDVLLDGRICKIPTYRNTPRGREICDFLLAVNRPYGKSDYIPCICWGRNARFTSFLETGSHVKVYGRIQSREYTKKLSETESVQRIAYEVSVSKIELVESEEE